jgi:hypothetical protein
MVAEITVPYTNFIFGNSMYIYNEIQFLKDLTQLHNIKHYYVRIFFPIVFFHIDPLNCVKSRAPRPKSDQLIMQKILNASFSYKPEFIQIV